MAIIDVSAQHNGGFLPGIILLTHCYYHRETCLNAMKSFFVYLQPIIPPKRFDIFPADCGMLRRSRCVQIFLQTTLFLFLEKNMKVSRPSEQGEKCHNV